MEKSNANTTTGCTLQTKPLARARIAPVILHQKALLSQALVEEAFFALRGQEWGSQKLSVFISAATTVSRRTTKSGQLSSHVEVVARAEAQVKISREVDQLRFVADCDPERGFVPLDIECCACGGRIDPVTQRRKVSLICPGCKNSAKIFWSEAQMGVFLAENWNALRQVCSQSQSME